ncbi:MAG: helix-turn-helix domain-containing protein [bacterium]
MSDTASRVAASLPTRPVRKGCVIRVLEQTDWIVHGPRGAARILGLNPSTLRSRMKKLRIRRPTP